MARTIRFREALREAMIEAGLVPPATILADGKIHRCDLDGKKGKRGGAYQLFPDMLGGGFQNWSNGSWQKWRSQQHQMAPEERARMVAMMSQERAKREAERAALALAARQKASRMWNAAKECGHVYLDRKKVKGAHGKDFERLAALVCKHHGFDPIRPAHHQCILSPLVNPTASRAARRRGASRSHLPPRAVSP